MNAETDSGESRTRARLLSILKLVVSVGLLWLLFTRVDMARLWEVARHASPAWLLMALALYSSMVIVSAWRWGLLLRAQGVAFPIRTLTASFLVATFFNNFLPSNIGGDLVRIKDTAPAMGSKTLATTVVLLDRVLGLLGLVLTAALGATAGTRLSDSQTGLAAGMLWAGFGLAAMVATPALLMPNVLARLLQPLRVLHPEWVDVRIDRFTGALSRFREAPGALGGCFAGALCVQTVLVAFYVAIAHSMQIPIGFSELAVIVPISFIVQMLPVSLNGLGVREATFGFYFKLLGLPLESALLVSFMGAALIMLFSLSGGVTYAARRSLRTA